MRARYIFAGVMISALFAGTVSQCGAGSDSAVVLRLEAADTLASPDKVIIIVTLENHMDRALIIYRSSTFESMWPCIGSFLRFQVVGPTGDTLVYDYKGALPKIPHERDNVTINSREKYSEDMNLTPYYASEGDLDAKDDAQWPLRAWPEGEYTVRCIYEYVHRPSWLGGAKLWQGFLESNAVTIRVVKSK